MLSARELEVMLLALVAELSAAGEFRRQRYLLWVGYNQNRLSPEVRGPDRTPPHPDRVGTALTSPAVPPPTQHEIRKERVAFFGQISAIQVLL